MFWSAKQYPELSGKTDVEIKEYIGYASKKSKLHRYLFWVVVLSLIVVGYFAGKCVTGVIESVIFAGSLAAVFYIYLIIDINYLLYPDFKKYFKEYENHKKI